MRIPAQDAQEARFWLSRAQHEAWLAHQLNPGGQGLRIGEYLELHGSLDIGIFESALREAVAEAEPLHVRFGDEASGEGEPGGDRSGEAGEYGHGGALRQWITQQSDWALPVVDLRAEPDPLRAARAWMRADLDRPLDPAQQPLFSYALLLLETDRTLWYQGPHRLVMDERAMSLLAARVAALYTARLTGLDARPTPFGPLRTLVDSDHAYQNSPAAEADRRYWQGRLAGLPEPVRLPEEHADPEDLWHTGTFEVPGDTSGARQADPSDPAPGAQHTDPTDLVTAALAGYLHRLTGRGDLVIGLSLPARPDDTLDRVPGPVANVLPLRLSVRSDTALADLVRQVSERAREARAHQRHRGEDIARDLSLRGGTRDFTGTTVRSAPEASPLRFGQVEATAHQVPGRDRADLAVVVRPSPAAGAPTVVELTSSGGRAALDAHLDRLRRIVRAFAAPHAPSLTLADLDLLADGERERLLVEWNGPTAHVPKTSVVDRFAAQARRAPDADAVVFGELHVSYRELDAASDRLAQLLAARGVGPESVVGLVLPRSVDMVVALLAVLKAGGAYLPVDPEYPAERVAYVLGDAAPALVLSTAGSAARFGARSRGWLLLDDPSTMPEPASAPADASAVRPATRPAIQPQHPAYVIYTSGSSGRPKGVVVPHAGLPNLISAQADRLGVRPESRVLQFASPSFDASVSDMFVALCSGATLVVAPVERLLPGPALTETVRRYGVTHLKLPPTALAAMPQDGLPAGLTLSVAGEPSTRSLVAQWAPGRRLVNIYGPTEATVCATMSEPLSGDGPWEVPPIGRPLPNTRAFVLDAELSPLPVGVPGELFLAGAGLARGYLGRPALTAERFLPNPFGAGERMYRTGDLVRWTTEGTLEYLGRGDDQVKIRGFRIELGEVETALAAAPGVARAAVATHADAFGAQQLTGYVVPDGNTTVDPTAVRDRLRGELPAFMVPAAVLVLDGLPLTPNGKLDRRALPAPAFGGPSGGPRTPVEEVVAGLFGQVLGLDDVSIEESFFDLGGHSLSATRLAARIRSVFGLELGLRELFEAPTVAALARRLSGTRTARPALRGGARPDVLPLSFAQARLWFLYRVEGPSPTYNISSAIRLSGVLDVQALTAALGDVVERHESLRTVFPDVDGVPRQEIRTGEDARPDVTFRTVREEDLDARMREAARHAFRLDEELPIRGWLYEVEGPDPHHVLLLMLHHITGDGWSMGKLWRDLAEAYTARRAGAAPGWAPLPVQYADYALWQRELLGDPQDRSSLISQQLAYWQKHLAGLPDRIDLPTDRPHPAVMSHRGETFTVRFDAELHDKLAQLARASDASLFMVVHAGLAALLSRLGAGDDVPVGGPTAGRLDESLDDLVGFFVNTMVLRADTSGRPSFRELVARVRETDLDAFAHQDLPFERVVEAVNPTRSLAHHPLFQVSLAWQITRGELTMPDLDVTPLLVDNGTSKFDLVMHFFEHRTEDGDPQGLEGHVEFNLDVFDRATAEGIADRLEQLLRAAVEAPDLALDRIDLLADGERQQLLTGWNGPTVAPPPDTIADRFAARAADAPGADAVVFGDLRVSYGELDAASDRLAQLLASRGVGPESVVGLVLPRSVDMFVAVLAVLKAGGAYLPVDPEYPAERVAYVLGDAAPALVLSSTGQAARFEELSASWTLLDAPGTVTELESTALASANLEPRDRTTAFERPAVRPEQPAYVIYTSGSTGRPKGVVLPHGALDNLLAALSDRFALDADDRWLAITTFAFDIATVEVLLPLTCGAAVVLADRDTVRDPQALAKEIASHDVTHLQATPSLWKTLVHEAPTSLTGLTGLTGGEALPTELAQDLCALGVRLSNLYGPTETTIYSTGGEVRPDSPVTIGRPLPNTRAFVLDAELSPVPVGVPGELFLAGAGLARGYLGRPALTAERFLPNPFGAGERMYRTGDLVRWTTEGTLEYLGRGDDQVKIRGFRIELGEVETALAAAPGVARAVVAPRADALGAQQLTGYVVPAKDTEAEDELRAQQLGDWEQIWNDVYRAADTGALGEDFSGWNSSYDEAPIPLDEMAEWLDRTVTAIGELRPRRILEIGVGSGLLLSRLAGKCDEYWGTDLSKEVVAALGAKVSADPALRDRVRLHTAPADDLSALPQGHFDTVVLNSVVQYFPSGAYLAEVLRNVTALLTPGGTVFVGDVRNLHLARTFHGATQLHRLTGATTPAEARHAIEQRALRENELLVAPEFFAALSHDAPEFAAAGIALKRGWYDNELSRYRYDVVLHTAPPRTVPAESLPVLRWGHDVGSAEQLEQRLRTLPSAVRVTGVPNRRLAADVRTVRALEAGHTGGDVLEPSASGAPGTVVPESLHRLGEQLERPVTTLWSQEGADLFDAVFLAADASSSPVVVTAPRPVGDPVSFSNNPAASRDVGQLGTVAREFVRLRLPDYMVPASVVVLDAMPMTANGKVDRKALPAPVFHAGSGSRRPRTPVEEVLTGLFAEVLGLPSVGVEDNFFDLGGHSLLATRLVEKVRSAFGAELGVRALFEAPTPAGLARRVGSEDDGGGLDVLFPLRAKGELPPLFCVHPLGGLGWSYAGLLPYVDRRRPVYALQARGVAEPDIRPGSIAEIAADYVAQIRMLQPSGPYHLLGWSFGGIVAQTMATQLHDAGERVDLLAVVDIGPYPRERGREPIDRDVLHLLCEAVGVDTAELPEGVTGPEGVAEAIKAGGSLADALPAQRELLALVDVIRHHFRLRQEFEPSRYAGDLLLFRSVTDAPGTAGVPEVRLLDREWEPYVAGHIAQHDVARPHSELMRPQALKVIGPVLAEALDPLGPPA